MSTVYSHVAASFCAEVTVFSELEAVGGAE